MTNDPSPKLISNHPRDPDSVALLPFPSPPKTYHRHHRWPPEPQQQLAGALGDSSAAQKPSPISAKIGGLAALFNDSGPPPVFSLWGV